MANTYLFMEGVPGNLSLFGTQGWHRLHSFSWANPGGLSGGGSSGYVFQNECIVTRDHDKMSAKFTQYAATGAQLPMAVIYSEARSGGMTITLRNCTISNYSLADDYVHETAIDTLNIQFVEATLFGGTPVTQLAKILVGLAAAL